MNIMNTQVTRLLGGALAVCTLALSGGAQAQVRVEGLALLEEIGRYPANLQTYFAGPLSAAEREARLRLSQQLGEVAGVRFDSSEPTPSGEGLRLTSSDDPSAIFELDGRTGSILFNGGMRKYREEKTTPDLPDAKAAVELARRQLESLSLPIEEREVFSARLGGLNLAVPDGGGGSLIYEKLRSVRFERTLAGLLVEGDARAVVQLGSGGALSGLVFQWPSVGERVPLEPSDPASLRKAALAEIEKVTGAAATARLSAVDLVLYDDGRGVMEPAYHFVIERAFDQGDGERTPIPYDFYLSAARRPVAHYPQDELAIEAPGDGRDERKVERSGDD